ncbi:MAG: methyltransferase [Phycisphaerae bacterium]
MSNVEFMNKLLASYGPKCPLDQLVEQLNNLYHAAEARDYDERHVEIREQLPLLWREMTRVAQEQCASTEFRILDFGCGTGFEADQLLLELPRSSISALTCYDPSSDMLRHCQTKISPHFPKAVFCDDLERLPVDSSPYNLLATNSLLHHVPNPVETVRNLLPYLAPDAVWIAGHEPSCRFYRRTECLEALERFQRQRKWRRFLQLGNYLRRLKTQVGLRSSPAEEAARESVRQGLFTKRPPAHFVTLLVDFHVAHSPDEAAAGRGLDFEAMQKDFAGIWEMVWMKTYSFMGPFYEGGLPRRWSRICRELAEIFPDDGCNFCTVWVRA